MTRISDGSAQGSLDERRRRSRGATFIVQMAYLAGLGALALLYFKGIWIHVDALGTVPIAVPWWGALGAVLLSLSGIFSHCEDWDPCFKYWHWARPAVGAAMATFGVVAFQSGVLAAGNSLTPPEGIADTSNLFYYAVAFVLGYREETTRNLIARVADVIIGPGETPPPPPTGPGETPPPPPTGPGETPPPPPMDADDEDPDDVQKRVEEQVQRETVKGLETARKSAEERGKPKLE